MRERQAQIILLVRAFEEVDRDGRVLSLEQRAAATRRAVMVTSYEGAPGVSPSGEIRPNEETLTRRARLLHNVLLRRIPSLHQVTETARLHSLMGPAILLIALTAGLLTQALGPRRHVNLLAFPLLGVFAWNAASYVMMLAAALARRALRRRAATDATRAGAVEGLVSGLADWVVRFALWRSRRSWKRGPVADGEPSRITARAFTRFCGLWHRLTHTLLEARVRRRLHLSAIALTLGVIGGMYLRGLAFEYQATWESTLLDASDVQRLMDVLLGPAASLLGRSVPDVAPLRAPGSGGAAIWIHLFAVTALLFIVVPRFALAVFEAWRSWRLRRDLRLDLDDGYYHRILADWRGQRRRVEVLPYSYTPRLQSLEQIKLLLHDFFGAQADLRVLRPLNYGDGVDVVETQRQALPALDQRGRHVVVLFNLAQTPEAEVHATFLEELKILLDPEADRMVVVIDATGYRAQTAEPRRGDERRQAWDRVVQQAGLTPVHVDPVSRIGDPRVADGRLDALRAALWPPRERTEAG